MTDAQNRDTGAPSRLALQVKRCLKDGDRVLLRLITTNGEETLLTWESPEVADAAEWARECSEAAQDDADAAGAVSNYVVIVEREGRAVMTQKIRRVPTNPSTPEAEEKALVALVKILTSHLEAVHKSLVTVTTAQHQPLIKVLEAMTTRVIEVEGKRADMVDEVTKTRFVVSEMAREMKEDTGLELDDKMIDRLEKIGNRAFDAWDLKMALEKMKLESAKG